MRKSWKTVAETLSAYMPLESLRHALACELALLEADGKRMTPAELAATKHSIQFLSECIENWG